MHCPNCGVAVESESIAYCRGCGQQLDAIRAAMAGTAVEVRGVEISRSGINLGVGLMLGGLLPALIAVFTSGNNIPLGLLWMVAALVAIIFGSGPLMRLFQQGDLPKEIERARLREVIFGSTLMFFSTIIVTVIVAATAPDSVAPIFLVAAISCVFLFLLAWSKKFYMAFRNFAAEPAVEIEAHIEHAPTTRELETVILELPPTDAKSYADVFTPSSVTEVTTRQLQPNRDEREN